MKQVETHLRFIFDETMFDGVLEEGGVLATTIYPSVSNRRSS